MMAVDISSLAAYFLGEEGLDVETLDHALDNGGVFLPCVCLSELISSPRLPEHPYSILHAMPVLYPTGQDFWHRVGDCRRHLMQQGKKGRLADTMIAVLCMDYRIPLLTRDRDFRHFLDLGLVLA